jgi:hypothetical protein
MGDLEDDSILKAGGGFSPGSALTKGWSRIKEGYLIKTKVVKGVHKSQKLRFFVLFQHPVSKQAQLEYYAGKTLKGSASLINARALPLPNNRFELTTPTRTFYLQAEESDPDGAATWTFALQRAIDESLSAATSLGQGHHPDRLAELTQTIRSARVSSTGSGGSPAPAQGHAKSSSLSVPLSSSQAKAPRSGMAATSELSSSEDESSPKSSQASTPKGERQADKLGATQLRKESTVPQSAEERQQWINEMAAKGNLKTTCI